jgi:hypothetical protein
VEIKRGLSPVLKPGFFSAVEDIALDKAYVVYGGQEVSVVPTASRSFSAALRSVDRVA